MFFCWLGVTWHGVTDMFMVFGAPHHHWTTLETLVRAWSDDRFRPMVARHYVLKPERWTPISLEGRQ